MLELQECKMPYSSVSAKWAFGSFWLLHPWRMCDRSLRSGWWHQVDSKHEGGKREIKVGPGPKFLLLQTIPVIVTFNLLQIIHSFPFSSMTDFSVIFVLVQVLVVARKKNVVSNHSSWFKWKLIWNKIEWPLCLWNA